MKVMIAGIAGASLGTEIAKSLRLAGGYEVYGCDISPLAYGHFDPNFTGTAVVDRSDYVPSLLEACTGYGIDALVAGAEKTMVLISENVRVFEDAGIRVCQNNRRVVATCNDKSLCFDALAQAGFPIPQTRLLSGPDDLAGFPMPCVIKPARDSGGSAYVFFAQDLADAQLYCTYLVRNGQRPLAQAYIDHLGGEFTVGVLSLPDGAIAGSIAMRRSFESKLSVSARGDGFLISSGVSQGEIRDYADIRACAEAMAKALGSTGPLNVQGRLTASGTFLPFEINPRFSASTYLRALAGFNEVDYLLRNADASRTSPALSVKEGWYLRSLDQQFSDVSVVTP